MEIAEIEVAVAAVSAGMVICDRRPLEEQRIVSGVGREGGAWCVSICESVR